MSMITEQVEYLINLSNKHPYDSNILTLQRACKEAAYTIKTLSYGTATTIGMALAKLELLEKQGCKFEPQESEVKK